MLKQKSLKERFHIWATRNKEYEIHRMAEGLDVMVETEASYRRTEKSRFIITIIVSMISTAAAIVAAVFAVLAYINA